MSEDYILERLDRIDCSLREVRQGVNALLRKVGLMSAELDALETQVKANTDAEASAVILLGKLSALITAAGTDPVKLKQLAADLDASKTSLAAAILQNTPASP